MSDPCSQQETLTKLQVRQADIAGDVAHIKSRLDNGMSHTIADIHEKVTKIIPIIEHHADIVKRIEDVGWLISRWVITGLAASLLALIAWAITKGFILK
jgi:hypothetical protein